MMWLWILIAIAIVFGGLVAVALIMRPRHEGGTPSGAVGGSGARFKHGWLITAGILCAALAMVSWIAVVPPGSKTPGLNLLAGGGGGGLNAGSLPEGVAIDAETGQIVDAKTGKVLSTKELEKLGLSADGSGAVHGSTSRGQSNAGGQTSTGGGGSGGSGGGSGGSGGGSGGSGGGGGDGGGGGGGDPSIDCAAKKNGGATDIGITATAIKLASNKVISGNGASFLADAPKAMEAVKQNVNSQGGICGRRIELTMVNDDWDATRGANNIRDFRKNYFALPVVPSSEGLSAAIEAGVIDGTDVSPPQKPIPVVGTDGMRKEQFDANGKASWVWSVALPTISQVRIMADWAHQHGANTMGIVYDQKYKFGVEGAAAFTQYIDSKLSGVTMKKALGIEPGRPDYTSETTNFKQSCNPCDLVVYLLEPSTAATWIENAGAGGRGAKFTMGGQPLFNRNFGSLCSKQALCSNIMVWSGYTPAIGSNVNKAGVAKYISDVRSIDPKIDVTNQFTEGAYLGMLTFVEALKKCSPLGLTRACIRQTMDAMTFTSDLSPKLSWSAGDHFANTGARAYYLSYSGGSFSGFGDSRTGIVNDPTPGVVPHD